MDENETRNESPIDDDLIDQEVQPGRYQGCILKAMSFLILLVFIAFSFSDLSFLFSGKLGFLEQNESLIDDELVMRCKPAIVSMEVSAEGEAFSTVTRQGTGFNISPSGLILTNNHLVAKARSITITFGDGRKYYTKQYNPIPGTDVATVKIAGSNLPYLPLNVKDGINHSQIVTIVGNPLGFEKISQRGKIGQFHRVEGISSMVFDIDVAANPGSSGSPVINNQGQAIGIIFASTMIESNQKQELRALAIPLQGLPNLYKFN